MGIKQFFINAFKDIKRSASAQHEVDRAEFEAAKAESRARYEEAKMNGSPRRHQAHMQAERDAKIEAANERKAAAEARIAATQNKVDI